MTTRSYKLIFIVLSCCVLVIICLQGYWIHNFYLQKKEAFDRSVYSSLDELNTTLRDRKNLQSLKMVYFIQNGDTIAKTPSHRMTVITRKSVQDFENEPPDLSSDVTVYSSRTTQKRIRKDSVLIEDTQKQFHVQLNGTGARVEANDKGKTIADLVKESATKLVDTSEVKGLVDKMLNEIKIIDLDQENPDTLHSLIKRSLGNKGIFLPFEFSMQNLKSHKEVLAQSDGFLDAQVNTYKRDLSANRVIYTGEFLFLQFPGLDRFLLANMKSSLLLSLLFSLVIISAFYYVIRIILTQKKLSEMKTDFVNNMTHELKTPIATISLAVDALANPLIKNDEEKFSEYTRILKEENKKLDTHVERVLQMALLDRGALHLAKKTCALNALLDAVLKTQKLQLEQKAELVVEVPGDLYLYADEGHIKTVFANLIDNALKYSGEKCRLQIWANKAGGQVRVHVKDNGIGIDADQQTRIFEKFYRVQGGNLHDVKGFGLGLSYVKSLVEAHGGWIELKSEIGKGSEFIVYFPTAGG